MPAPKIEKKPVSVHTRLHPAVVQVAIPSPPAAGKPFQDPAVWHAAHANNLRRMFARAGYDEMKYREPQNDGRGAVITFGSYVVGAVPGVVPDAIQLYLDKHLSGNFIGALRFFVNTTKGILDVLDDIFPAVAVVTVPAIVALDKVDDALEEIDDKE